MRYMFNLLGKDSGFTLIESVIALLLIAMMLSGGLALYLYSQGHLNAAIHRKMATNIANSRMEEIKNGGYGNLPDPAPVSPGIWTGPSSVAIAGLTGTETDYVFEFDADGDGLNDSKHIRVDISWHQPDKTAAQHVTLDTIIAAE